jgi:Na+-driven multidrug efflux pump
MRVSFVANLLNILLNYPLITGWGPFPELGLAGAAVSTLGYAFLDGRRHGHLHSKA